jgi:hypothetical protein
VGWGGGGRSFPSANPDNVAAGGATDAQCGGRGERRGGMGQITAHSNPHSSFSLSFFPLCVWRGFDEKILHLAVQYISVNKHIGVDKIFALTIIGVEKI